MSDDNKYPTAANAEPWKLADTDELEARHLEVILMHGWHFVMDGDPTLCDCSGGAWSLMYGDKRIASGGTPGAALRHALSWLYIRELSRPGQRFLQRPNVMPNTPPTEEDA